MTLYVRDSQEGPWVPAAAPDNFGNRLIRLRAAMPPGNLSQLEAAKACDLRASTWASWENGALPRDLIDVVTKIVAATGVDRDWLLFGAVTSGDTVTNRYGPIVRDQLFWSFNGTAEQTTDMGEPWTTPDYSTSTPNTNATEASPPTPSTATEQCSSRSCVPSTIAA